mgnify:CR=1 FL=1
MKRLYLFGNVGNLSSLPKSGGQTSARRVIKGLEDVGFEVVPIVRHRGVLESRIGHFAEILFFALIDLFKIILVMIGGKRKNTAFLHLTFSGPLVPYEYVISCVVRMMGYKSITYLQGGQFMDFYDYGSSFHKSLFKRNMQMQELVMFEGLEGLRLVKDICSTPLAYFPGYAFDEDIPQTSPNRSADIINICCFGRVAPGKNTLKVIEAFNILCSERDNIRLFVVGGAGQSKNYVEQVDEAISKSPYRNKITRKGLSSPLYIKSLLQECHIFLFPTQERCEGHSNALTEAMTYGVVPVVSDWHFNRSIVGRDDLVVKGYDPADYAKRIFSLIDSGELPVISVEMIERVRNNYSCTKVNASICNKIEKVLLD